MFIVIQKITSKIKKDEQGKVVRHPITEKVIVEGMKVVEETIRVDDIKSAREYHDPKYYKEHGIDGPVSIVYFIGNKKGDRLPEVAINESIDSWNDRIGAIRLKAD